MTKVDMKYTSLFCRLGFVEEITDRYVKKYPELNSDAFQIEIEAELQKINYGNNQNRNSQSPTTLNEHKDFVVLECVNNLLKKGYKRKNLQIIGNAIQNDSPDIIVYDPVGNPLITFECKRWGQEFEDELVIFKKGKGILHRYLKKNKDLKYICLYSSRLDGGLLDWKYVVLETSNIENNPNKTNKTNKTNIPKEKSTMYYKGIFEGDIKPYSISLSLSDEERNLIFKNMDTELSNTENIQDFMIKEGKLLKYKGNKKHIKIPDHFTSIGIGAFWNCTSLVSVIIPEGIERIGGDAFYYCTNLKEINIPSTVVYIGNDPFAGCPNLNIKNASPNFKLEDGVLYDKNKKIILHYTLNKPQKHFEIPEGVEFIGKHTFYDCKNLNSITIPKSVIWAENNIFAGCDNVKAINHSPFFALENGVFYNKEKTQLYSVYDQSVKEIILPKSLRTIGKNSFFNCKNLEHLTIPESVTRIGYNPFVGCSKLKITNYCRHYVYENGILLNKEKNKIIYCPNTSVNDGIEIPNFVETIGRNTFSFCINLKKLDIPQTISVIERGAFSGCSNLESVEIPRSVKKIGKWAFSYCTNLKKIKIPKETIIGEYLLTESSSDPEFY